MATLEVSEAFAQVRAALLAPDLVRAVLSGKQRTGEPAWRRVEIRPVDLKSGRHLQIVRFDATQSFTANHLGPDAESTVDELLCEPFGNVHLVSTDTETQMRVTKKGQVLVASKRAAAQVETSHDRTKQRLVPADDPLWIELGVSDPDGRLKPSRADKFVQVEEFLRQLDVAICDARGAGKLRRPTAEDPLRLVDLGCGNGYLTFAAARFLAQSRDLPVVVIGVDVKEQSKQHNDAVAERLGLAAEFVVGTIDGVDLDRAPDVVLALHACDTATDDALARAIEWGSPLVLAAPCCHHDIAAQLRRAETPEPYAMLTRHGILRERLADTLTDALRASLLRTRGYRVEVVQFVASQHTPRNTMLRAVRTGAAGETARAEYDDLTEQWGLRPKLGDLLGVAGNPAGA
ncbi:MAG: class I SAM-dependent methyltransferase [Nocardioides sp.]